MNRILTQIATATLAMLAVAAAPEAAQAKGQTYSFQISRTPGAVDRVAVVLELGGVKKELVEDRVEDVKLSAVCRLRYDERMLDVPKLPDGRARSVRYYDEIDAVIKFDDDGVKPKLRAGRRLIAAEADGGKLTLFSPHGTLRREELELIDLLGNSLLLDRLLPEGPLAVGDSWQVPKELIVALLRLDAAAKAEVSGELTEVTKTKAMFAWVGRVEGATGGVSTRIELKAKYRFNRKTKRIDWFGLAVKEERDIGHVAAGLDTVARLQVQIAPVSRSPKLSDAALKGLDLTPTDESARLAFESQQGGWRFTHDRRWHVTADHPNLAVLRLLDRGELLAQCNVAPLAKRKPGKQVTLDEFQHDVQKALGESFGEFVRAGQFANGSDYRVFRVVVRGVVEQLPIAWRYYLVADKHGRQVVFAFTVEQSLIERFGKADENLIAALRFLESPPPASS